MPGVHNFSAPLNEQSVAASAYIDHMRTEWTESLKLLRSLQEQTIAQANRHRQPHTFKVGDPVLVNLQRQRRRQLAATGSLGLKAAGPFYITRQIAVNTFELALPPGCRIHNVFNA